MLFNAKQINKILTQQNSTVKYKKTNISISLGNQILTFIKVSQFQLFLCTTYRTMILWFPRITVTKTASSAALVLHFTINIHK